MRQKKTKNGSNPLLLACKWWLHKYPPDCLLRKCNVYYYTLVGGCYVKHNKSATYTQEGVKVRISTVVRANN